ncbi:MAG TPA: GSCFA domain-containing protein [Edaphocola sp.]|nr:GSCFA domain-containing protein [Edaphocola sp.]
MQLQLSFPKPFPSEKMTHKDRILLAGSCFTENIGRKLQQAKFQALINPHGISFSPLAIASSLEDCFNKKEYQQEDLIFRDELWHGLDFHTDFSAPNPLTALNKMNASVAFAHAFLYRADWLLITAGTAFQYYLIQEGKEKHPVANCHKIPAAYFEKRMLEIKEITGRLKMVVSQIRQANPGLKIIWTVSPVRHIRDGLMENNRSKARLIEAFRQLAEVVHDSWYYPSYEILIDVLRDYRFYDKDLVHPSMLATDMIWEQFSQQFFEQPTNDLIRMIQKIRSACQHEVQFPGTGAHRKFVENILQQMAAIGEQHPEIDFSEEQARLHSPKKP